MKTVFSIGNDDTGADTLLLEIGEDYCCYALLDNSSKSFQLIRYISFNEFEAESKLGDILHGFVGKDFKKVVICSAYAQALLVPQKIFKPNDRLESIIYDTIGHSQFNDQVAEWQIVNSYSIPTSLHDRILDQFPSVVFFHAYTPSLKIYNGFVASDQVDIHFTTQNFRVLVKKDQQVHLAQTYSYKTPLDVVYYLLKICYEFELEQSEVFLIVSGLVDQDSAMYHELHNYFLNIHFAQAPAYSLPETEHPHYYFTSLYNLAACVS
ncbi:MAG: DUF3822 family protein [Flavisolibacter sp.]